jgi:hypothetical protein
LRATRPIIVTVKPDWVHNVEGLLQDWKVFSLQETKAIQTQDWDQVRHIQQSIQEIMGRIEKISNQHGADDAIFRQWLAPQMTELLDLERENSQNLGAKLNRTRDELEQSRTSGHKLNQIKSAYGVSRDSVMIHQYT